MGGIEAFYLDYKDRLFGFLLRLSGDRQLSADLVQESFTKYLTNYPDRESQPPLLFAIARRAFMDYCRKNKKISYTAHPEATDPADLERDTLMRDEYHRVLKAMEALDELDRQIISLVASANLSYREVAAIVGLEEGNVKVRVHRTRLKLRQILEENR